MPETLNQKVVRATKWSSVTEIMAKLVTPLTTMLLLARLVGCPGYGRAITFACISIPLAAFSSIQSSLYRRDFDFKTLFGARLIGVLTPLLVTTPLAFFLRNFWALVIGTIVQNLMLAVYLTLKSPWKPRLYYSWKQLKQLFGFSMWTISSPFPSGCTSSCWPPWCISLRRKGSDRCMWPARWSVWRRSW